MAKKAAKKVSKKAVHQIDKFQSHLGNKEVYPVRVAKEVTLLIDELKELPEFEGFSNGEILEYVTVTAFKAGLLCGKADMDRISKMLNEAIRERVVLF